ncbi:MAG: hypothetical protein ACC742_08425 [Thermoanaerobaculales bacterium]
MPPESSSRDDYDPPTPENCLPAGDAVVHRDARRTNRDLGAVVQEIKHNDYSFLLVGFRKLGADRFHACGGALTPVVNLESPVRNEESLINDKDKILEDLAIEKEYQIANRNATFEGIQARL